MPARRLGWSLSAANDITEATLALWLSREILSQKTFLTRIWRINGPDQPMTATTATAKPISLVGISEINSADPADDRERTAAGSYCVSPIRDNPSL